MKITSSPGSAERLQARPRPVVKGRGVARARPSHIQEVSILFSAALRQSRTLRALSDRGTGRTVRDWQDLVLIRRHVTV